MLKIKVEGYKDAKRILDDMPNNMQKNMLGTALRGSAKPIMQSARNKVPVKSGKLKKMLRIIRFRERNAPGNASVGCPSSRSLKRPKRKGPVNEFYGKFIHEGTADPRVSRKGKMLTFENQAGERVFVKSVKGIKATPFLEQAYAEGGERTVTIFGDELARAVEKYVAKNFKILIK